MKRALLVTVVALAAAACSDQSPTAPPTDLEPNLAISDGAHGGNGHFFFLPPLVPRPHRASGEFDPDLNPVVEICELNQAGDACVEGSPVERFDGSAVAQRSRFYQVNWNTRRADISEGNIYRIRVLVGAIELGFRDVTPVHRLRPLLFRRFRGVFAFIPIRTIPIKFVIEEGALSSALCAEDPGNPDYDCTAQVLGNNETAVCDNATCSLTTPENGLAQPTLFLVERVECTNDEQGFPNWLDVDIPQYGGCMRVTVFDPEWQGFLNEELAVVATCPDLSTGPPLYSAAQDESMQLHVQYSEGAVEALPPRFSAIDADCVDPDPDLGLAPGASVGQRLAWAAKNGWYRLRTAVSGLVTPSTAYAFHTGFGGHTRLAAPAPEPGDAPAPGDGAAPGPSFATAVIETPVSVEFRMAWAIPSQMEKVTPLETVIGYVGEVIPVQVKVTDNGRTSNANSGDPRPVNGASVHFAVINPGGLVAPGVAVTNSDGIATVNWTLQPEGSLVLEASGFGIGVRPHAGFGGFDALGNLPRALGTGTLTFEAIVCEAEAANPGQAPGVLSVFVHCGSP